MAEWDPTDALYRVSTALGVRARGVREDDRDGWRSRVVLPKPVSPERLAVIFGQLRNVGLDGGRVHFGATLQNGVFIPMSFAFTSTREAASMAMDEALRQLTRYGQGLQDLPLDPEEFDEEVGDDDGEAADLGDDE